VCWRLDRLGRYASEFWGKLAGDMGPKTFISSRVLSAADNR
jgi:hypothetical protein